MRASSGASNKTCIVGPIAAEVHFTMDESSDTAGTRPGARAIASPLCRHFPHP